MFTSRFNIPGTVADVECHVAARPLLPPALQWGMLIALALAANFAPRTVMSDSDASCVLCEPYVGGEALCERTGPTAEDDAQLFNEGTSRQVGWLVKTPCLPPWSD